jgi:hypothetical protein
VKVRVDGTRRYEDGDTNNACAAAQRAQAGLASCGDYPDSGY